MHGVAFEQITALRSVFRTARTIVDIFDENIDASKNFRSILQAAFFNNAFDPTSLNKLSKDEWIRIMPLMRPKIERAMSDSGVDLQGVNVGVLISLLDESHPEFALIAAKHRKFLKRIKYLSLQRLFTPDDDSFSMSLRKLRDELAKKQAKAGTQRQKVEKYQLQKDVLDSLFPS